MLPSKRSVLRGLMAASLATLVASCVEPSRRSEIAETIDRVSFAPPPGTPSAPEFNRAESGPVREPGARVRVETPGGQRVFPGRVLGVGAGGGTAAAERSADGVQLNFDRAEIREVAKVILGDILGVSYTINPDVQGEVTLSSSAPLSERDLLAVLESVLRSNGASLVATGPRTYQIVPADAAIGRSEIVPLGGRPIQVRPGYGITIIPLRNISATAAAQFIQPLVASPEDIRIDPGRNAILFSGTAAERQNVIDTVRDLDVDWMAGKSIGLFPLERTSPEALIPELQAIFSPFDPTGAEPSLIRFLPVARLNAVLAIGGDPEQMQEVDRWVTRLDRGEVVGTQFYVYYLKHASAEDIAKILNDTYADSGGATEAGPSLASATTALTGGATDGAPPPEDGGLAPPPGGPGGAPSTAPSTPSGPIKVVASKANNALLIRATPDVYDSMEATLLRLDTAPWQVLIEATIAEVALNNQLQYGVQYFIQSGSFAAGFNSGGDARVPGGNALIPQAIIPGFNFIFTPASSNVTIDALSRITDVKVLSAPSVVVQDNSEAVLTVGEEVPITTRQGQSLDNIDAPIINNIEYRDTGVILQVRPRINSNQAVSLEIAQEVSRVDENVGADPLTPRITQRKVTSRVTVQSGQTVALGGLIQDTESRGRDRIPVLGEIPVIGNLFGTTSRTNARTELIIFLTPRVIRNAQDAQDVSEELRSRLKSLSPSRAVSPMMPNVVPVPSQQVPPQPAPPPAVPGPARPQPLVPHATVIPRVKPVG